MTISDLTGLRLRSQQLLNPAFKTPAEIVRWFGAIQSQDFAGSMYAIGARLPGSAEAAVEQALTDKTIVRTWPMRRTIHCLPAEDARWMVQLLAPRQNARMGSYYRKAGITKGDLDRAGSPLETFHLLAANKRAMARLSPVVGVVLDSDCFAGLKSRVKH